MSGFKPFSDDWPEAKPDLEALDDAREAFKRMVDSGTSTEELVDEVLRGAREKAQHRWIATHGEDLSGHDFGCEWIWVMRNSSVAPILLHVGWNRRLPSKWWTVSTHYMPTDIRTPEPPQYGRIP